MRKLLKAVLWLPILAITFAVFQRAEVAVGVNAKERLGGASLNSTVTMPLENYNDWNLPFAMTFSVASTSTSQNNFPTDKYLLEMDPGAIFSIIFVDTTLVTIPEADQVTCNYTFYGQNGYTFIGQWLDLHYSFTIEGEVVEFDLTTFVSYQSSPETGV